MLLWKRWQLSVAAGLNLSSLLSRCCFSARRQHGVRCRNAAACMHWAVWAHAVHLFIALVSWHDADCFAAIATTVVHVHHFGQICFSHSSASLTACIADWTCMQQYAASCTNRLSLPQRSQLLLQSLPRLCAIKPAEFWVYQKSFVNFYFSQSQLSRSQWPTCIELKKIISQ